MSSIKNRLRNSNKIPKVQAAKSLLTEVPNDNLSAHQENEYVDFDYEGLIYQMISQEGPALAVGDIDLDGNEDFYIGGASGQPGTIYKHTGNGNFKEQNQAVFVEDSELEDTAAAFFDADGDGDTDLMVGSGGNQVNQTTNITARLYLNDGTGIFTSATLTLPPSSNNVAVISPKDYDGDGDIDVFIGSRSVIGLYGVDPSHLFLENQGNGEFINVSKEAALPLKAASGMITDAQWLDLNGDGTDELLTVSEWGSPKIYKLDRKRLVLATSSLDQQEGWWNTVQASDLDNDGDLDLILGNQGLNIHYTPTVEAPMKMWINDFDNNGTVEQIVTQTLNGRDMPIHQKKEILGQMVSLKKQNLKASEYANKSIQQLFSKRNFRPSHSQNSD